MTDFMRWLYANYIRPQLDREDPAGYEQHLSLMDMDLTTDQKQDYEKAVEFYAGSAFLLGLRTGAGLAYSSQNSFGSTQPSI